MLGHVFGDVVWVEGELVELTRSAAGHVYFRLVDPEDPGGNGRPATLNVTLFDSNRRLVNRFLRSQGDPIRMTDGLRVRVGGRLAVYPERSNVQLLMDRIDPAFTLGLLGRDRARLLAELRADGLLRENAERPVPVAPLHVGVVTSVGSAAHADVLHELEVSGIGFEVDLLDARTQGADAPESLVAALTTAADRDVDVILLVRGGGAATDLAAFDAEVVARAVAGCGVAVWTGIGHETDRSVAGEVAHSSFKTPTAAAAAVVDAVRESDRLVGEAWAMVRHATASGLERAARRLDRTSRRITATATHTVARTSDLLGHRSARLGVAAPRRLRSAEQALNAATVRLGPAARRGTETASGRLDVLDATTRAADPAVALRRGWSMTRTADGRLLRSVGSVADGVELITTVSDGSLRSVVVASTDGSGASGQDGGVGDG